MQDTARKPKAAACGGADECAGGLRNRYFPSKRLRAADFQTEQDYLLGRRRLINRAVLGWGVVYGFALPTTTPPRPRDDERETPPKGEKDQSDKSEKGDYKPAESEPITLTVGEGLALDSAGREVVSLADAELDQGNTFLLAKRDGLWSPGSLQGAPKGRYVLSVHYAERPQGLVVTDRDCGCGTQEASYVCETVAFSLRALGEKDRCPCGEPDCPAGPECVAGDSCCGSRGPHSRLCDWTADPPERPKGRLCSWNGLKVGMDGVPLACVTLVTPGDECHPIEVIIEDACGPRRFVKTNDLIYDLLRGCDLTRITEISWAKWHRSTETVAWSEFQAMVLGSTKDDSATDFVVTLSGPVKVESLQRPGVLTFTVLTSNEAGWRVLRRVPVTRLQPDPTRPMAEALTDRFRIMVQSEWVREQVKRGQNSEFNRGDFRVEIEMYGDLVEDCSGQQLDANTPGIASAPSGNGSPGGLYRSCFRVQRMPRRREPTPAVDA